MTEKLRDTLANTPDRQTDKGFNFSLSIANFFVNDKIGRSGKQLT